MRTETVARKKWCPMTRYRPEGPVSNLPTGEGKCIASECMAWRWRCEQRKGEKMPGGLVAANTVYSSTQGFCGLAGA